MNQGTDSYRTRIYERYALRFQDVGGTFDVPSARRWGRAYDYYLRRWLPARKDAVIAELGCGRGRMLHFLKERGYRTLEAIDISPDQVAVARQVLEGVEEGDALTFLETRKSRFDLIIAIDLIEHLQKSEVMRFLDLAHSALAPAGSLILQTPNAGSPWFGTMRYNDFTHEVCFNGNSVRRMLGLCGFAAPDLRETNPVPWGYSVASSLRFVAWRAITSILRLLELVETGHVADGIYTRNMLVRAQRAESSD